MSSKLSPEEIRKLSAPTAQNTTIPKPTSKEESRQLAIFQRKQEFAKAKKEKGWAYPLFLAILCIAAIANGIYIHAWQTGYDECKKVQAEENAK